MPLSVIIPWRDSGCVFRSRSVRWVLQRYWKLLPDAEVILGGKESRGPFNRSAARNEAVGRSHGDVLLIADADTVFQVEHIATGIEALSDAAWVIPYSLGCYYNLSEEETEHVWASDPGGPMAEPSDPDQWEHKLDSWAGLLLVRREDYDAVGGYDERFNGWGYEDNAFRSALDHRIGEHARTDGFCLHLWHPAPEATCFGQPNITANRALCEQYERGVLP